MTPLGTDLSRRWLAALLAVPEHDRKAVVEAIEKKIADEFPV